MSKDWFYDEKMRTLANETWKKEIEPMFEELEAAVVASDNDVLKRAGLSGSQLEFKMYIFGRLLKNESIEKTLGAINTVLSSLSLIPSFCVAEPIKEFKDFLELGRKHGLG